MKKLILIILIITGIILCSFSKVSAEINQIDFYIYLNNIINDIRYSIENNINEEYIYKKYLESVYVRYDFSKTNKEVLLKNHNNEKIDKIYIYIKSAIYEKYPIWLDESSLLLYETFGDYSKYIVRGYDANK